MDRNRSMFLTNPSKGNRLQQSVVPSPLATANLKSSSGSGFDHGLADSDTIVLASSPVKSTEATSPKKGRANGGGARTFGPNAPHKNVRFPQGNLTLPEILTFFPDWLKSVHVVYRIASNGFSIREVVKMLNYHRDFPLGPQTTNGVLKMTQITMREGGMKGWTMTKHRDYVDPNAHWDRTSLDVSQYKTPAEMFPERVRAEGFRPGSKNPLFKDLVRDVKRFPEGPDALDLTRCVQYAVDHPDECSHYRFPEHYKDLLAKVGGPAQITAEHVDGAVNQRWLAKNVEYKCRAKKAAAAVAKGSKIDLGKRKRSETQAEASENGSDIQNRKQTKLPTTPQNRPIKKLRTGPDALNDMLDVPQDDNQEYDLGELNWIMDLSPTVEEFEAQGDYFSQFVDTASDSHNYPEAQIQTTLQQSHMNQHETGPYASIDVAQSENVISDYDFVDPQIARAYPIFVSPTFSEYPSTPERYPEIEDHMVINPPIRPEMLVGLDSFRGIYPGYSPFMTPGDLELRQEDARQPSAPATPTPRKNHRHNLRSMRNKDNFADKNE